MILYVRLNENQGRAVKPISMPISIAISVSIADTAEAKVSSSISITVMPYEFIAIMFVALGRVYDKLIR